MKGEAKIREEESTAKDQLSCARCRTENGTDLFGRDARIFNLKAKKKKLQSSSHSRFTFTLIFLFC